MEMAKSIEPERVRECHCTMSLGSFEQRIMSILNNRYPQCFAKDAVTTSHVRCSGVCFFVVFSIILYKSLISFLFFLKPISNNRRKPILLPPKR